MPEQISAKVLELVRTRAEEQFGFEPREAVVTVPAYFNHSQREATQNAAKLAGLKVLRLLNEPTAAALSLAPAGQAERILAVYDFGGGTFDISVIRIQGSVYEVLATNGDTFLGGDDIDGLLCDELAKLFENQTGIKIRNFPLSWYRLRDAAQKAKKELSRLATCAVFLPRLVEQHPLSAEVSRNTLDDLARPLIERSLRICERTLSEAGVDRGRLDEVVLVGGQTRMPLLRQMVEDFFGRRVAQAVNPDTAVAEGAAREGAMLRKGGGALLIDVTPLTLGINIIGNRMYPLIPRNTKVPVRREHIFTTHRDSQTTARMAILQGDNPVASENVRLGELVLSNLHPKERFQARIKVAFEIDSSGILHVKALDEDTRQERKLTITNSLQEHDGQPAGEMPESQSLAPADPDTPPTLSGPFREMELIDVLCFLHANSKTGRICIHDGEGREWELAMLNGQITHARGGQEEGERAVEIVLGLKQGTYSFQEGLYPEQPPNVDRPFQALVS
ncbi:MAG: DUF4388 domain-containing protein [Deltaproteobacteria bacterium]|nr:MAG: DUF4388 domain-containing protein [Deltaproteobacteria bacterium]